MKPLFNIGELFAVSALLLPLAAAAQSTRDNFPIKAVR